MAAPPHAVAPPETPAVARRWGHGERGEPGGAAIRGRCCRATWRVRWSRPRRVVRGSAVRLCHLSEWAEHDPHHGGASSYVHVSDPTRCSRMAGGRLIAPDTPYGLREFAYVDPDGAVAGAGMALMATGFLWWTGLPVRGSYLAGILPGLLIFGLGLGSGGVAGSIAAVAGVGGLRHCLRAEQRRVPDRRCAGNRRPVHGRGLARRRFDDAARPHRGISRGFRRRGRDHGAGEARRARPPPRGDRAGRGETCAGTRRIVLSPRCRGVSCPPFGYEAHRRQRGGTGP